MTNWLTKSNAIWALSTAGVAFVTIALANRTSLQKVLHGDVGFIEGITNFVTGG